jgi:hypothetical protein
MKEQYETFAKELSRRFEEQYRDTRPPLQATLTSIGGENVEISVRAIDRSFAERRVLVSFMEPNAVEVAWDILTGVAEHVLRDAAAP